MTADNPSYVKRDRLAILLLCAGLLLCCAVGISMLFGCAGVALLVLGYLLQRDFPELGSGNAGDRFELVPPPSGTQAPPRLRHRDGPRHVRIVRPSVLVAEMYDWQADE